MTTINGGGYDPVEVEDLDLVGYLGQEKGFVIINPIKRGGRKLPHQTLMEGIPMCIYCVIRNNQAVNLSGEFATLHDINGKWHIKGVKSDSTINPLINHIFFEIGHRR